MLNVAPGTAACSKYHWYAGVGSPVAKTLNAVPAPAGTVTFVGCKVITGSEAPPVLTAGKSPSTRNDTNVNRRFTTNLMGMEDYTKSHPLMRYKNHLVAPISPDLSGLYCRVTSQQIVKTLTVQADYTLRVGNPRYGRLEICATYSLSIEPTFSQLSTPFACQGSQHRLEKSPRV